MRKGEGGLRIGWNELSRMSRERKIPQRLERCPTLKPRNDPAQTKSRQALTNPQAFVDGQRRPVPVVSRRQPLASPGLGLDPFAKFPISIAPLQHSTSRLRPDSPQARALGEAFADPVKTRPEGRMGLECRTRRKVGEEGVQEPLIAVTARAGRR